MRTDVNQISFYDSTLRNLLLWLEGTTGLEFVQTSLYRKNSAVHGTIPLRAVDLSCRVSSIGAAIEDFVNTNWIYDPQRPEMKCAYYHDSGQGPHLHIQVHPHTVFYTDTGFVTQPA